jgi:hypothetical protein
MYHAATGRQQMELQQWSSVLFDLFTVPMLTRVQDRALPSLVCSTLPSCSCKRGMQHVGTHNRFVG